MSPKGGRHSPKGPSAPRGRAAPRGRGPSHRRDKRQSQEKSAGGLLFILLIIALVKWLGKDSGGTGATACAVAVCGPVDSALALLPTGDVSLSARHKMVLGQQERVSATLVPARPEGAVLPLWDALTGDTGAVIGGLRVRYSPRMIARLTGQAFDISPASHESKPEAISNSVPTVWHWQVTPSATGKRALDLSLEALVTVDGIETPRTYRLSNSEVDVSATWGQRISHATKWLQDRWSVLVALVALFAGWKVWPRIRKLLGFPASPIPATPDG